MGLYVFGVLMCNLNYIALRMNVYCTVMYHDGRPFFARCVHVGGRMEEVGSGGIV